MRYGGCIGDNSCNSSRSDGRGGGCIAIEYDSSDAWRREADVVLMVIAVGW